MERSREAHSSATKKQGGSSQSRSPRPSGKVVTMPKVSDYGIQLKQGQNKILAAESTVLPRKQLEIVSKTTAAYPSKQSPKKSARKDVSASRDIVNQSVSSFSQARTSSAFEKSPVLGGVDVERMLDEADPDGQGRALNLITFDADKGKFPHF